jgi:uncharacterized protein DUF6484
VAKVISTDDQVLGATVELADSSALAPSVRSYQPSPISGVTSGKVRGITADGIVLVEYQDESKTRIVNARACVEIGATEIGRDVVLAFDAVVPGAAIVIGVLQSITAPPSSTSSAIAASATAAPIDVEVDGRRVTVHAVDSLTLRCGAASITLTREGTVLIRGTYVQSRSSGVQRIQGGAVHIN